MEIPEIRYATASDGASIAFQVVGSGPPDLVFINSSYVSNVELVWEWPPAASFLRGLAQRGRLILFDRRGTGLSDKVRADHFPTLEARMDDIRAVMDTVGRSGRSSPGSKTARPSASSSRPRTPTVSRR